MWKRDPRKAEIGEDILPFEMGYLPEIYLKKAEEELHETPERRAQCMQQLKEMLKKNKRFKDIDFEEDFLLQHLRARKFNLDRAYTNVRNFVNFTKKHPYMFTDLKFEVTVKSITDNMLTVLPWRCQDGCAVFIAKLDSWMPDDFPMEELKRGIMVYLLQSLHDPLTQVNGFKVIIDVKTASLRHLRYCTPQNLYTLYDGTQNSAPARYKGIHIVNDSVAIRAAWQMGRHLLSKKLKQRIHFHSSNETLLDFFPSSILPTYYGGELEEEPKLANDQTNWLKRAMSPERLALIGGGCLKHLNGPQ